MNQSDMILITGGNGFLGTHLIDKLEDAGFFNLVTFSSEEFNLVNWKDTVNLFKTYLPSYVIHLAAVVGGIGANKRHPGSFFYKNMQMGLNVIECSRLFNIDKIIVCGTICSYPKLTPVPFKEDDLWNGYPEPTNAPYGIAKKSLLTMLQSYYNEFGLESSFVMPTNMYGPRDSFDINNCHVIPALIRKFHEAKLYNKPAVECWGTGNVTRDFLYVEDAAEAILKTLQHNIHIDTPMNLGANQEIKIKDLAQIISKVVGYDGAIVWNDDYPDGQPKRLVDASRSEKLLDWHPSTPLKYGIKTTYEWYKQNVANR